MHWLSSQWKLALAVVPGLLLLGFTLRSGTAHAATSSPAGTAVSDDSAPPPATTPTGTSPAALPPPPPAPVSPFTGASDGPTPALPLPPPPPAARNGSQALPPAPAPRTAAPGAPPGAPGSDLPPLPPPPYGARYHDGFYLRMALGLGASGALVSSDATSVPNYSFAGGGAAADLWIGGTPARGLAMGGGLSLLTANSTTRHVDGRAYAGDVSGAMGLLGFFVDGFPDPERGFHFGGTLGLVSAQTVVKGSDKDKFTGGGVGLGAWLGYDMFVSPQWSLGGMVRLMGSLSRENRQDVNYQTSLGGASLSFTALYH